MSLSMQELLKICRSQDSKMVEVTQKISDFSHLHKKFDFKNAILNLFNGLVIDEKEQMMVMDEAHFFTSGRASQHSSEDYYTHHIPHRVTSFNGFKATSSFELKYDIETTLSIINDIYKEIHEVYEKEHEEFLNFIYNNNQTRPFFLKALDLMLNTQDKEHGISNILDFTVKNLDLNDTEYTSEVIDFCLSFNNYNFIINRKEDVFYLSALISKNPKVATIFSNRIDLDNKKSYYSNKKEYDINSLINDIVPDLLPKSLESIISSKFNSIFFDYEDIFNTEEQKEYFKSLLNMDSIFTHFFHYCEVNHYSKKFISDFVLKFSDKFEKLSFIDFEQEVLKRCWYIEDIKEYFNGENLDSVFHGTDDEVKNEKIVKYLYGYIISVIEKDSVNKNLILEDHIHYNKKRI